MVETDVMGCETAMARVVELERESATDSVSRVGDLCADDLLRVHEFASGFFYASTRKPNSRRVVRIIALSTCTNQKSSVPKKKCLRSTYSIVYGKWFSSFFLVLDGLRFTVC